MLVLRKLLLRVEKRGQGAFARLAIFTFSLGRPNQSNFNASQIRNVYSCEV